MPFALIFVAVALIVAGFRGTQKCLFSLIEQDANKQFVAWAAAIIIIGSFGYVDKLAPVSNALLVLVIVVMFLTNGTGAVSQIKNAIGTVNAAGSTAATTTPTSLTTGQNLLDSTGIGNQVALTYGQNYT